MSHKQNDIFNEYIMENIKGGKMRIYKDLNTSIRTGRRLLKVNEPIKLPDELEESASTVASGLSFGVCVAVGLIIFISGCLVSKVAHAEINKEKLANAIYLAEGGTKTRHPYGILTKYKKTTPRQACINTIKSALKRYKGTDEGFIAFLGKTYCPVGAKNDPKGLNKHWVKNVKYYYNLT